MTKPNIISYKYATTVFWILVLFGLYVTSLYSYLLFHSIAEIFSIIVACGIFMVAWNSRRFLDNNYLLFVGIAYLFIGFLDLIHALAYRGMGVFPGYATNLPTQLWIAARYTESLSLLIAPFFVDRKLKTNFVFISYVAGVALVLSSIFYWSIFPDCFIEGVGLTPFKKISEYIIALILLASIALLIRKREAFDRGVLQLLVVSLIVTIGSELAFTFYVHAYGLSNLIGHFFKIISFVLIYKAIIQTGLVNPYNLLFRNLKQSEEKLRKARDGLEKRVRERTAELAMANKQLGLEIEERKRAEEHIFALSQQLMKAQEIERQRLSCDLHDNLAQDLSSIKIGLDTLLDDQPDGSAERRQRVSVLSEMIRKTIMDVRNLSYDLHPGDLDQLGLVQTVRRYCEEFSARNGLEVEFLSVGMDDTNLDFDTEIALYRLIQEGLTNIQRHADASKVTIRLVTSFPNIILRIQDNGKGFPVKRRLHEALEEKRMGLRSMQQRVALLNGKIEIKSHHGKGTKIVVEVPYKEKNSA